MKENIEGTKDGVEQQLIVDPLEEKTENESTINEKTESNKTESNKTEIEKAEAKDAENNDSDNKHISHNDASTTQVKVGTNKSAAGAPNTTLTYKSLVKSLILGLIIILLTACAMGGPINTPQVVKENFVTSQNSMKNMKGSGGNFTEVFGIRDHWVYFESTEPIVLKDQEQYKPLAPEELKWKASFFKIYTPEIDALSDTENLSGIQWKKGTYPVADEKYMLTNKRTHEYFFSDRHVESDGF